MILRTEQFAAPPGSLFAKVEPMPVPAPKAGQDAADAAEVKHHTTQRELVFSVVKDGRWWTVREVLAACDKRDWTDSAVTARLRDFRKPQFGGYRVDCRQRAGMPRGVMEYRVFVEENTPTAAQPQGDSHVS